ncbi:MAG TPA: acyl-CoA dehydrogenase family protein [Thermoanaerobaculia bacterium]|nr:acyl-CoA dehydrogenase family protein [Thermoanaerobaculia bacterium]
MDFELSKEQRMIVGSVATFVKEDSPVERFREMRNDDRGWDPVVWKQMGDYGWLAIAFSEEDGGIGGSFLDMALILEQLAHGLVPEPYIPSVVLAGGLLARLGSAEQKQRALRPILDGDASAALAYGERQSRYDLTDCLTRAERSGDGYRLDGEKTWVLNGHSADWLVVSGRTGGSQLDREGLSLFLIPADAAGITRTPVRGMDGQLTAFLRFDGVEVGADALLGTEGQGADALEWAIDRAAAAACAEGQGLLQQMFSRTVEYLNQREQFGVKIGSFQALQHRAADMFAEVELCKGTMILAALEADSDDAEKRRAEISAAKLQLSDGGWYVQENAIQLHGGVGVTDEQDVGLYFKRLRVLQGLFGDADHHVGRYARSSRFVGAAS